MYKIRFQYIFFISLCLLVLSCSVPKIAEVINNRTVPVSYNNPNTDSANIASIPWRSFFTDTNLVKLIDTALKNNQELNITLQEIEIAKNEILSRKGTILPSVNLQAGAGFEKVGLYTSQGAGDASADITPGKGVPETLPDYTVGLYAHWEVDIWKKLHNAKKAAVTRYLSTVEGRNFVLTNLIAEIAGTYYELVALDNQLDIVRQNIELQKNVLEIVKVQKEAMRATELAVQKFQAEVLGSQSLEYEINQKIKEAENTINLLLGRYPQNIARDKSNFTALLPQAVQAGIPSQLLANRPDIRQAELNMTAAKLDVHVAHAEFYPSFDITSSIGLQAFNPSYLVKFPESILYSLAGDIAAPLINRAAIKAEFNNANARQVQALYNYQRTVLNAYLEVANQLSKINNLANSYDLKSKQVEALTKAIDISNDLFKSAHADYLEVLMTQRDALEAKLDLIDTKKEQLNAVVNVYRDLGGGWK